MNQFKMGIQGMTCIGCEEHIEKALERIGATNIKVNFRRSEALFQLPDDCAVENAIKAVKETNYQPGETEKLSFWEANDETDDSAFSIEKLLSTLKKTTKYKKYAEFIP